MNGQNIFKTQTRESTEETNKPIDVNCAKELPLIFSEQKKIYQSNKL